MCVRSVALPFLSCPACSALTCPATSVHVRGRVCLCCACEGSLNLCMVYTHVWSRVCPWQPVPERTFFFTVVPIVRLAWTTQTSCDKKGHNMRNSKQKKSPSLWLGMLFVDPRNALSTTGSAVLSFLAPCLHCEHMSAHISAHMSAHISMHMSAHTHVCTHVYTHVCTRVCANVRTHVLAHVRTHVLAHVRIHALAHVCTHHACTQHACTYFLHVCLHTCLHTSLAYMPGQICYTHVCTHVCTHLLRACLCTCPYT